jgi:hypothetical protein
MVQVLEQDCFKKDPRKPLEPSESEFKREKFDKAVDSNLKLDRSRVCALSST